MNHNSIHYVYYCHPLSSDQLDKTLDKKVAFLFKLYYKLHPLNTVSIFTVSVWLQGKSHFKTRIENIETYIQG